MSAQAQNDEARFIETAWYYRDRMGLNPIPPDAILSRSRFGGLRSWAEEHTFDLRG
jgi:hypothetical protein